MEISVLFKHLFGPLGGTFGAGLMIGGVLSFKYIAPKLYSAKILALEEDIKRLNEELKPWKNFKNDTALAKLAKSTRSSQKKV